MFYNKKAIRKFVGKQSRKKNYSGVVKRVEKQGSTPSYQ
jgi:hypothetical protein